MSLKLGMREGWKAAQIRTEIPLETSINQAILKVEVLQFKDQLYFLTSTFISSPIHCGYVRLEGTESYSPSQTLPDKLWAVWTWGLSPNEIKLLWKKVALIALDFIEKDLKLVLLWARFLESGIVEDRQNDKNNYRNIRNVSWIYWLGGLRVL